MFLYLLVLFYIIFIFYIFCFVLLIEFWFMFDGLLFIFLEFLIEERKIL